METWEAPGPIPHPSVLPEAWRKGPSVEEYTRREKVRKIERVEEESQRKKVVNESQKDEEGEEKAPLGPTFGVTSGRQDGARRAEEVREITGKTFHLLLRCLPTGEERFVAGSTSALPPRQPVREEPEGCGRGKRLSVHGAGGYDSITFSRQTAQAERQQAPVKLRAARGNQQRTVSARLRVRVAVVHCVLPD
ncbi:hypothetical protein PAMP_023483 [Pampus punctatissimus]